MLRITAFALFALIAPAAAIADEEWTLTYMNRETGGREESGGWATRESAIAWFQFIQVPYYENGRHAGSQYVNPRVFKQAGARFPSLPTFMDLAIDTSDTISTAIDIADENWESLRDRMYPSAGLQGYADTIALSYDLAKKAKEGLLNTTTSATEEVFKKVNGQIDQYNRDLGTIQSGPSGGAFRSLPQMTPVSPNHLVNIEDWNEVAKNSRELRNNFQSLDEEVKDVLTERNEIIAETQRLDQEERELRSLEASAGHGPYTVVVVMQRLSGGPLTHRQTFQTIEEAREGYKRFPIQAWTTEDRLAITDSNGRSYNSFQSVKSLSPNETAELKERRLGLERDKQSLDDRRERYKQKKSAYDATTANYSQKITRQKSVAEKIQTFAYNRNRSRTPLTPRTQPPRALRNVIP